MLRLIRIGALAAVLGMAGGLAVAQDVRITESLAEVQLVLNGQPVTIARNQDQTAVLTGEFARTSRACPPFCIHPMSAGPGVATLGELEVLDFLANRVATGQGILMDSRLPEFFARGTIPGAVNVPFATLAPDNPYRNEILMALGAVQQADGTLDMSGVIDLALFCNGPWCDQSPRAIRYLLDAGYPPSRLFYYRGGMQDWQILGLTTAMPGGSG